MEPSEPSEQKGYPAALPRELSQLRRQIEKGDYESVEEAIWANPRLLVSVCDSATHLMAGPKYNACHIAARANKPEIMALLLDTIANCQFVKKLYPDESDSDIKTRTDHLLDSYLNTPDPRQGNTPLHFACRNGHHRVVRVLLTFEGCDLNLRDSWGQTAEESISCIKCDPPPARDLADQLAERLNLTDSVVVASSAADASICSNASNAVLTGEDLKLKIKRMFKQRLNLPLHRVQLKNRLILEGRRHRLNASMGANGSFSDLDESFVTSGAVPANMLNDSSAQ